MDKKQMDQELVIALQAAGVELAPVVKQAELTVEQKVARIQELLVLHAAALATKDVAAGKKVRRQLRNLGFRLSEFRKVSE